jgi:GH15 family glucan-1,4-alpha-glucosidase
MLLNKICLIGFTLLLFFSCASNKKRQPWKGSAIIGNGEVCAVYSDDERLSKSGIQHFYYKDYTADYISSSSCEVYLENGSVLTGEKTIEMANFYTTSTKIESDSNVFEVQVNSLPDFGVIISLISHDGFANSTYEYKINFRKNIQTDKIINHISTENSGNYVVLKWNNNTSLIIGMSDASGQLLITDSVLTCKGKIETDPAHIFISASDSENDKTPIEFSNIELQLNYWEDWMNSGIVPQFEDEPYLDYYKRNLYAAKAANLNGMIPADITGQFVTNNMPQLYPRDAMMIARVFTKTGHFEEANQVIEFWTNKAIPRKSKGEWYARYDAYGNAVNAGSGARYDEPEWDANGYFIQLLDMYHKKTGEWLVDSLQIYEIADFLVNNLDKNNLLFEGGIIEWSGYLPATNMTAAAALTTVSEIAKEFGNNQKSYFYKNASNKISNSLKFMFDKTRNTYTDVRFAGNKNTDNSSLQNTVGDTLYLWDTSSIFGILWGYPNHKMMQQTNDFYATNTVKYGGGVQYFNAPDQGLASYGNDMFFFTTAARAQYLALNNNIAESQKHIDWMIDNSNIYGLMPERIYLNNQDCSDASPLSWCCAEFTAALIELHSSSKM